MLPSTLAQNIQSENRVPTSWSEVCKIVLVHKLHGNRQWFELNSHTNYDFDRFLLLVVIPPPPVFDKPHVCDSLTYHCGSWTKSIQMAIFRNPEKQLHTNDEQAEYQDWTAQHSISAYFHFACETFECYIWYLPNGNNRLLCNPFQFNSIAANVALRLQSGFSSHVSARTSAPRKTGILLLVFAFVRTDLRTANRC